MSKLSLSQASVDWAIDHLVRHGDTDVFPHPFELRFFGMKKAEIVKEAKEVDLNSYQSQGILETLSPKGKIGFRICHQPHPIDSLFLTAALHDVAAKVELARRPQSKKSSFSYRVSVQGQGELFSRDCKYHDWIEHVADELHNYPDTDRVIRTDISDFYQRIYHHRIENNLLEQTGKSAYAKFIFRIINNPGL